MVIMCSHGRGGAPDFSCNNILVPLDGNPDHAQALPVSKGIGRACGAALHLAIVIPSFASLSGELKVSSRMLPATASRMLEIVSQEARERPFRSSWRCYVNRDLSPAPMCCGGTRRRPS